MYLMAFGTGGIIVDIHPTMCNTTQTDLGANGSLQGLLNVGRETKEGGAVRVGERGDEREVVPPHAGHRERPTWQSLSSTSHWRHILVHAQ